ncbi:hypothetical protein [Silvibacterium sp.]|uniref:hypothetical protein n=1 Tax=Silvibacterium sp. TaxID=1964179 RepID=UPI0039E53C7B
MNIPNADDYPAILGFANQYVPLHGLLPKFVHVITFQQSEYKTMLVNGVTAVQCELIHRVSLPVFMVMGNLIPIGIFVTVLAMYKRRADDLFTAILSVLPVSLLLFQLQYSSTLDWATAGMQNLPVIFSSLLAILFLSKSGSTRAFGFACFWLVIAVCSSANGFGLSIVGGILLLEQRRLRHLLFWALTALAMGGVYFYKYNFHSSQAVPGATVGHAFLHFNLLYAISFLGSSGAGFTSYVPSVALGLVLLCVFAYICFSGYSRRNVAVFYSMVFVVLSAFGVAGLRGALGVVQSLASRYRIYSNLMLVLVFIYLMEIVLPNLQLKPSVKRVALSAIAFLCILFCLGSDWAGLRFIEGRKQALIAEMARWEHPSEASSSQVKANDPALERQLRIGIYKPIAPILIESIHRQLYLPPQL